MFSTTCSNKLFAFQRKVSQCVCCFITSLTPVNTHSHTGSQSSDGVSCLRRTLARRTLVVRCVAIKSLHHATASAPWVRLHQVRLGRVEGRALHCTMRHRICRSLSSLRRLAYIPSATFLATLGLRQQLDGFVFCCISLRKIVIKIIQYWTWSSSSASPLTLNVTTVRRNRTSQRRRRLLHTPKRRRCIVGLDRR